jgi:hypothetical protein
MFIKNRAFGVSPNIIPIDRMNRLTNMADAVGASSYLLSTVGLLQAEDGPWGDVLL